MFCPQCGESNPDNATKCSRCSYELIPPLQAQPLAEEGTPPPPVAAGTSMLAIWSLILGIVGAFCLGPLAAIPGLIVGFMALSRINKSQGQLRGTPLAIIGIIICLVGMVIWLAISAILMAIAVPNFLEAQTRSKVSRARNDLRTLSVGLESYKIDNLVVPPYNNRVNIPLDMKHAGLSVQPTFAAGNLTTPVAFLSNLNFSDPFAPSKGEKYCYYADPSGKDWILWGAGPDGKYSITDSNVSRMFINASNLDANETRANATYDPTNGTISSGDIWRASDGAIGR